MERNMEKERVAQFAESVYRDMAGAMSDMLRNGSKE
jgi:hypothetical protein